MIETIILFFIGFPLVIWASGAFILIDNVINAIRSLKKDNDDEDEDDEDEDDE
jgi:hypothetical protein